MHLLDQMDYNNTIIHHYTRKYIEAGKGADDKGENSYALYFIFPKSYFRTVVCFSLVENWRPRDNGSSSRPVVMSKKNSVLNGRYHGHRRRR